jgi:hypothetical protein
MPKASARSEDDLMSHGLQADWARSRKRLAGCRFAGRWRERSGIQPRYTSIVVIRLLIALAACLAAGVPRGLAQAPPIQPVELQLEQFGVGSQYRPGDPLTAIRVTVTSNLTEPTPAWVQWKVPDADGEIVAFGRPVTLTPGRPTTLWLYAPLPASFEADSVTVLEVLELRDDEPRDELASMRFSPRNARLAAQYLDPHKALIAVIGRDSVGVEDYSAPSTTNGEPPGAMEDTRIINIATPEDLPDRWFPLQGIEAIIWSADAAPTQLRLDPANALRDYVQRGGHLVIILPQAGNPWGWGAVENPANRRTELDDLLPRTEPRLEQGVPLQDLLPIISKSRYLPRAPTTKPIEFPMDMRVFAQLQVKPEEPELGDALAAASKLAQPGAAITDAQPTPAPPRQLFDNISKPWRPLIALPDGRVIAIQRTYGHGRITLVGLNVGYRQLQSVGLPHADVLWNRILGRRCDTPRNEDLSEMEAKRMLAQRSPQLINLASGELMEIPIRMAGEAAQAVLLSVLLFGVYWLAAGLVGYAVLKHYRQQQHAWLVFLATAGLFTLVAWGSVRVIRGTDVAIRHITFLDHVAEPQTEGRTSDHQLQKAVSWFSVYMPNYGRQRITIEPFEDQSNLLLSWHPPHKQRIERFPNVDRYRVDIARKPADYAVPSRATAKQFYANYLGPVSAEWGGMLSADPNDPIRVDPAQPDRLLGTISHNLPGNLRNVRVMWVNDRRIGPRRYAPASDGSGNEDPWFRLLESGDMLNAGMFWKLDGPLEPGRAYQLAEILKSGASAARLDSNIDRTYIGPILDRMDDYSSAVTGAAGPTAQNQPLFRDMLSIFQGLTPPDYIESDPRSPKTIRSLLVHREIGRELDLSGWFNRPAVIIMGELEDSPSPLPVTVNGQSPDSRGLTVVRWIYPLDFAADTVITQPAPKIQPTSTSSTVPPDSAPSKADSAPVPKPGASQKPSLETGPSRRPRR